MRRAALLVLIAAIACSKSKGATDSLPIDAVTHDDVVAERERVAKGENVGPAAVLALTTSGA